MVVSCLIPCKGVGGEGEQVVDWCTFNATRTVCVLLAIPTTTEPCLTASDAYSTWKMRPCGELWFR